MEIDEQPESVVCAHGLEWQWEDQHYVSPHDGSLVDAGALPEKCYPVYASKPAWQAARDLGVV